MSDPSFTPGPGNLRALRDALGCFGTGVTVVTTRTETGPLGITANSFASLSLDPALVLWAPARASRRHDPFVQARHFAIHVMAEDQHALARHFAVNGSGFESFEWAPSAEGTPILSGCLARFECETAALHEGGDHTIVVGRVIRAAHRPGQGLMFKRGQYGGFFGLDD